MKKLHHELTYPGATIDQVATMLGDPAFREAVCDAQHVVRKTVSITHDGDTKTVEMEQVQATAGVPGFARKIVGEHTRVLSEEQWSSPSDATLTIDIPGKPGDMAGTIRLREAAGGVVETVDLSIVVHIPLLGGKVEGLLLDLITSALKRENQVGLDWLAR